MLDLEALFMMANILYHTSLVPDFRKTGNALLKDIFEKVVKF